MHLIIHDLKPEEATLALAPTGAHVLSDEGTIRPCIGCFGCWTKTPGQCVLHDGYENLGELLSQCEQLTVLSQCLYGGFSPFVKNVLDRSISYVQPGFVLKNKETHHRRRYDNLISLRTLFYGQDLTHQERATAVDLVYANALNLDARVAEIAFRDSPESYREVLS
jgi:multimeric flavodoxin WrbA